MSLLNELQQMLSDRAEQIQDDRARSRAVIAAARRQDHSTAVAQAFQAAFDELEAQNDVPAEQTATTSEDLDLIEAIRKDIER